jgi:dipeptidyl aminopeptidase/acylaminoacyl peptidase
VLGGPYEVVIDELPVRWVERADLALALSRSVDNRHVVVRAADDNEFVRLPWPLPAPDDSWNWFGLSPDGRYLVAGSRQMSGLCWCELATGQMRQVGRRTRRGEWDFTAVVAPDSRHIATLSALPDPDDPDGTWPIQVSVNVVDVATGRRRSLWQRPGGLIGYIGWSPDQRMIAATYLRDDYDDEFNTEIITTIVVDTDGTVIGHYPNLQVSSSQGAWLDNHQLLAVPQTPDEYGTYDRILLHVYTGTHRPVGPRMNAIARVADRLIYMPGDDGRTPTHLASMNIDGTDPQPYMTIHPRCAIDMFDQLPAATPFHLAPLPPGNTPTPPR